MPRRPKKGTRPEAQLKTWPPRNPRQQRMRELLAGSELVGPAERTQTALGLPYLEVQRRLAQEFPDEPAPSLTLIRWLAVQMRAHGEHVPPRPRGRKEMPS